MEAGYQWAEAMQRSKDALCARSLIEKVETGETLVAGVTGVTGVREQGNLSVASHYYKRDNDDNKDSNDEKGDNNEKDNELAVGKVLGQGSGRAALLLQAEASNHLSGHLNLSFFLFPFSFSFYLCF